MIENDGQAERLKAARRAAGFLSAADAANRHNWPYGSYSGHENGSRGIGRAVFRYAKAFRVSAAWLLTGEGPGLKDYDPEIAQAIKPPLALHDAAAEVRVAISVLETELLRLQRVEESLDLYWRKLIEKARSQETE